MAERILLAINTVALLAHFADHRRARRNGQGAE
jgi:hypothetical protein